MWDLDGCVQSRSGSGPVSGYVTFSFEEIFLLEYTHYILFKQIAKKSPKSSILSPC